ncbi:MAG: N-acylmannosamine kinase [Caproiciproducens sp.]|nr:N-acylmannosamine kinase [Caproiciproducens sp.]
MSYYIGLDIGGTKCAVTLGQFGDDRIHVIQKYKFATIPNNPYAVLSAFNEKIHEFKKAYDISGLGISCGGPLNSKRGVIMSPPNLPGWDRIPVIDYFKEKYAFPVFLQNDANACAVAEWKYGAGKGLDNLVFLTFGTGLGAGIILNGRLYSGTNDMAGELGHWRISKSGPVGYGKEGSFEGFCSGSGIAAAAREAAKAGKCPALLQAAGDLDNISAKLVADLADSGDRDCKRIYATSGRMLGRGLAQVIDLLNPQAIIIGSIFTRSRNLLWEYANKEIKREALSLSAGVCEIKNSQLGEQIGDFGALAVASGYCI